MKDLYHSLLILIIVTLLPTPRLNAQEITDFRVFPENITNTDEVLLIVTTGFPFTGCSLDSVHSFFACGAFSFDAFYNSDFQTGSCTRTDTISLGVLSNGSYVISYRMYYLGWSQVDQADTFITVGTTGLEQLTGDAVAPLRIWPNPSTGTVNISTGGGSPHDIGIRHISGKNVYATGPVWSGNETITISLPPGIYVCTAGRQGMVLQQSKLIVTRP
jgi:hypothetical protein